jgi:hypothetical protein
MSAHRIDPDHLVGEKRVGRRAKQKRRWDRDAYHPCSGNCGNLVGHNRTRCRDCWAAAEREQRDARRREIKRRWEAGESLRETAAALDSTPKGIGIAISQMRKDGWDVPYRHGGYA